MHKFFTADYHTRRAKRRAMKRALAVLQPLLFKGIWVPIDGEHVNPGVVNAVFHETFENYEIDAMLALVQPNDRIIELGGGMGVVSGVLAKSDPSLIIESYEANPVLIPAIQQLHDLNDIQNVTVNHAVLTHGDGTNIRHFHIAESFAESSLLSEGATKTYVVEVAERNINQAMSLFKPNVLLCDIEGGETELFDGIDLTGIRAVVLELHPHVIGRAAEAAIYDAVLAQGLYPRIELCGGTVVAFERVEK